MTRMRKRNEKSIWEITEWRVSKYLRESVDGVF